MRAHFNSLVVSLVTSYSCFVDVIPLDFSENNWPFVASFLNLIIEFVYFDHSIMLPKCSLFYLLRLLVYLCCLFIYFFINKLVKKLISNFLCVDRASRQAHTLE